MKKFFRILIVTVGLLVGMGLVIHIFFGDKRSEVFCAAEAGNTNSIGEYLNRGGNINALLVSDHAGYEHAPLIVGAVREGHLDAVEFLLKHGADPNKMDDVGYSPLIWVIGRDQSDASLRIMKMLLSAGADPNLRSSSPSIQTPISWAAQLGHTEMVRLLVAAGANVNATNSFGTTPLHHAANAEVALTLLAAGANPSATCTWTRGDPPVKYQATPADIALEQNRFPVLAVLTNCLSQRKN